jgi:phage terminase large subunit
MGYRRVRKIILPHDARAKTKASLNSIEEQARSLWSNAEIIVLPATSPIERVKKGRSMMKYCFFDEKRCAEGIRRLENYKKRYNRIRQAYDEVPLHDENSHGADSWGYSADYWAAYENRKEVEEEIIEQGDFNLNHFSNF